MAAQVIEVAPGLDIEALTDVALKAANVQAGILVVERQFGYLEIHSRDVAAVKAAAEAVLDHMGLTPDKAMKPKILASRIVTRIDPGHAFLINRNKGGSMILAAKRCSCWKPNLPPMPSSPPMRRRRRPASRSSTTG